MAAEEFGYDKGKGHWLIIILVIAMAAVLIGYTTNYFFPDLANWMAQGVDPDKTVWITEFQGKK